MVMTEVLTEREQQALEHMRKAQELGSTLKAYAAAKSGLEIQQLYELRRRLVRKGAFGQSIDNFVKSPSPNDHELVDRDTSTAANLSPS
jgi:hypothetical protein